MKKKILMVLAGAAAAGAYAAVKGKGIFNRPRFARQHEAIERYIDAKHKNSEYSPIEQISNGWCTVVTEYDGTQFVLYMTVGDDGVYIFSEEKIDT